MRSASRISWRSNSTISLELSTSLSRKLRRIGSRRRNRPARRSLARVRQSFDSPTAQSMIGPHRYTFLLTSANRRSVLEVADTAGDHGHPVLVGGGYDFRVSERAPRMEHRGRARPGDDVEPIAEGEEGVRGAHRSRRLEPQLP